MLASYVATQSHTDHLAQGAYITIRLKAIELAIVDAKIIKHKVNDRHPTDFQLAIQNVVSHAASYEVPMTLEQNSLVCCYYSSSLTVQCTSLKIFYLLIQLVQVELPEPVIPSNQSGHIYARANVYPNSFFPRTISDWKKLHIATLTNVSVEEFKNRHFS